MIIGKTYANASKRSVTCLSPAEPLVISIAGGSWTSQSGTGNSSDGQGDARKLVPDGAPRVHFGEIPYRHDPSYKDTANPPVLSGSDFVEKLVPGAPLGALVGMFIPVAWEEFLYDCDFFDLKKFDDIKDETMRKHLVRDIFSSAFYVGNDWRSYPPFPGKLILLMNDLVSGYDSSNQGELSIMAT